MRKKLGVAVTLALVTAIFLYLYAASLRQEEAGGQKIWALAAGEALKPGTKLTKSNLAYREIPQAYLVEGTLTKADEVRVLGQAISRPVAQNEPLTWNDFGGTRSAATRGLSARVQKGQRAMTVPVDLSGSLAGMLRPGDHIDIIGTFARGQGTDWATVTLLQNILVLATGSSADEAPQMSGSSRTFSSITVSVDLEEAELLSFAIQRGPLNIALRSEEDILAVEDIPDKTFGDIFEVQKRTAFVRKRLKRIEALKTP